MRTAQQTTVTFFFKQILRPLALFVVLSFALAPAFSQAQSYAQWLATYGLPADASGSGALNACPVGDGIVNVMKFGMGLSPFQRGYSGHYITGTTISGSQRYLAVTYTQPSPAATGIAFSVEGSSDLSGTWSAGGIQVSNTTTGALQTIVVRDTQPMGGAAPKRFIRLKIVVTATVPANTVAPQITGSAQAGKTLSASTGTWGGGTDAPVYSYQWTRNGVVIAGATASTYQVTGTDIGTTLAVRVTAMNIAGLAMVAAAGVGPVTTAPAGSSTYYVSTATGTNTRTLAQAQSPSTPWKTIQKAATNMVAGDTCLIESGTYPETVTVSTSGSAGAPITFKADAGQTVVISGADSVTGWSLESTHIYYASMSWNLTSSNQVFVSGTMVPEARWPNAGSAYPWQNSFINPSPDWSYIQTAGYSGSTNGWFTDSNLPSRANNYWVGATVHAVQGYAWVMMNSAVLSSTGTTITTNDAHGPLGGAYSLTGTSSGFNGNEYYLSGIKGEMDSPGEWYYSSSNSRLYLYSATTPTNVQAKRRPYGFILLGHPYIQLANLNFFACTIQTNSSSTNETFNGLSMLYLNHSNVSPYGYCALPLYGGSVLRNCVLGYNAQGLLSLNGSNIKVINNYIHDSGYMADAAPAITGGTGTYNVLISHNTISNTGHSALAFPGHAGIVEFNDMSNAMRLLSDGGILYSNGDAGNSIIRYNLFHDSPGPAGHLGFYVQGFYLDDFNSNWIVHHNIISNVQGYSFLINSRCNTSMYFNNTCANLNAGAMYTSAPGRGVPDGDTGVKFFNNIFGVQPGGNNTTLDQMDFRYNLYTDPGFIPGTYQVSSTNAQVVNQGVVIPGVTYGYLGASPDLGALETGSADWTSQAGYSATPPNPDPTYSFPAMTFSNQVQNGSFESGALTGWTVSGSVSVLNANSWNDSRVRTGYYGLQFGQGTSEVSQTVTGLQPNRRYKFYAGTQTGDTNATVTLGVRNYGNPTVTLSATATGTGSWKMNSVTFFTGTASTSAQVYLDVTQTSGTTYPVYADDFAVQWDTPAPPSPALEPIFQYTLNQSSGSTATDSGPNMLNGTVNGTVGWSGSGVPGIFSQALLCNGSNTCVVTPTLTTPGDISMSCWARSNTKSVPAVWDSWGAFFCQPNSYKLAYCGTTTGIALSVFYINSSGTLTYQAVSYTPPAGFDITQWHNYGAVISTSDLHAFLYVDGIMVVEVPIYHPLNVTTGPIYIGHDTYSDAWYFNGLINDARAYNQALTPAEFQAAAMTGTDTSLKVHLAFDESSGAGTAWDSSGFGNSGTLVNANPATAWGSGIVNGALTLNGTNSCVTTPAMTTPGEITMTCWARSNTTSSPHVWDSWGSFFCQTNSIIFTPAGGSTGIVLNEYYTTGSGQLTYQAVSYTPPAGFDITQWHLYGATISSQNHVINLYIDGLLVTGATMANPINTTTAPIYIGHDTYDSTRYFKGQLDDARIYSRILNWSEMLELSEEFSGTPYY